MPLIEGSRSKNVLANSESSDLLNEENIPNGEDTAEKAKNINNTEVSGGFQIQIIARHVLVYQLYVTGDFLLLPEPEYFRFIGCCSPQCHTSKPSPTPGWWCQWPTRSFGRCIQYFKSRYVYTSCTTWTWIHVVLCGLGNAKLSLVGWVMQSSA